IIMVANKYAFLQITRRRFLNEWEAFKKVISRRNIRRRIRSEERFSRNAETDLVCRLLLEKKNRQYRLRNVRMRSMKVISAVFWAILVLSTCHRHLITTFFPYTTLFRSHNHGGE